MLQAAVVYAMEVLLAVLGAAALILCLWSFIVCWHDRVTTVRREQEVTASTIHTLITFNPPHNSLSYFPLISSFVGLHFFLLTSKHPRVVQKSKTHATFRLALSLASIRLSKSTPRPPFRRKFISQFLQAPSILFSSFNQDFIIYIYYFTHIATSRTS